MHFSIPDTREFCDDATGSTYTGYNVYINGSFHCCLRYKQLHNIYEQLKRHLQCDQINATLPSFPAKRLLPLTKAQIEQRRMGLESFLQLIGQDPVLSKLNLFQTFLLNAQQESAITLIAEIGEEFPSECCYEIVIMNGYEIKVQCSSKSNTGTLLQKTCESINLSPLLMQYFCLFLMRSDDNGIMILLRRLMDFEVPFISQKHAAPCQIVLRKSYWNLNFDLQLIQDSVGLNLLFLQTLSDVEHEWVIATPEVRKQLCALRDQGNKLEYMELARQLPLYGCIQFHASAVDYPYEQQAALVSIGNKELSIRTFQGAKIYETKFRVTRMRCWRVTAIHQTSLELKDSNLQLSFEYLISKHTLRWITITSSQAMLMSACLQSMVEELLRINMNATSCISYTPNDSIQTVQSRPSHSSEMTTLSSPNQNTLSAQRRRFKPCASAVPSSASNTYSAASAIVFFRNPQERIHNDAFEGIGDDDL